MIELIDDRRKGIVAFRIDSTASELDLKPLLRHISHKRQRYGSLSLFVEYVDSAGFSLDTLLEVLNDRPAGFMAIRKIAIVTFGEWLSQARPLTGKLSTVRLKSFSYAQQQEAQRWIEV